jgi:2-oxoglutarate ferredoxin oxidoreductase subunit alpha
MNPAAPGKPADLEEGGTLIVNTDGFTPENLKYANYASNPLEDNSLAGYRVHKLPISTLNMNALKGNVELSRKEIDRSKNFFALGVLYWLYDRPETTLVDPRQVWKESRVGKGERNCTEDWLQLADTTEAHHTTQSRKRRSRRASIER